MILEKENLKLHTEERCLCSASKENCFDIRNNIAEERMANIALHVQQGAYCVLSVQHSQLQFQQFK